MIFASPSSYFGMQLVCGKNSCPAPAQLDVGAFSLYVRETSGPGFNAPSGLWQTGGWIRGTWPFVTSGDSPSGLCTLSAALDGQLIDTTTSPKDVSTWHQCAAPAISQPVDTTRYGQGAVPLTLSASDAAAVPASLTKTVYIDNTPTVSLSGPVDAPSTAGTQYVTATAGGSPSGIAQIVCSVDGGPGQAFAGASAQVPVGGIGQHSVACFAENNAVDPSGAHGTSTTGTWSLKIGQPTELGIAFDKLVGLRCHRVRVRVTIRGHWITMRRHGKRVKVKTRTRHKIERVERCTRERCAGGRWSSSAFAATATSSGSNGSGTSASSSPRTWWPRPRDASGSGGRRRSTAGSAHRPERRSAGRSLTCSPPRPTGAMRSHRSPPSQPRPTAPGRRACRPAPHASSRPCTTGRQRPSPRPRVRCAWSCQRLSESRSTHASSRGARRSA